MYKIAIIGAGNLAWHLAIELEKEGHRITEVYSRHIANAKLLTQQLYDAKATSQLNLAHSSANLFILAVADNALVEVASLLRVPTTSMIVHTSGTQPLTTLEKASKNIGVFYPLQTFTKAKSINFKKIPICIEAANPEILDKLGEIATNLSDEVYVLDSQQRQALHVAAVIACNFTNHLFTIAKELLDDRDMDFEMLYPLIHETVTKAMSMNPADAQTGPAKRGDTTVLEKHIAYLKTYPTYKTIYQKMTASILKMNKK